MGKENFIIINADDFGINEDVNKAVITCFQNNWLSSATLLMNMAACEPAIHNIHTHSFIKGKIGIHINLTEGQSLSERIKKQKRFCNSEGFFVYNRKQKLFWLSRQEKRAVYDEIKTQIDKALKFGIIPTHIDSHHHIHTEWGIANILREVLKEYKINKIRKCRNMGSDSNFSKTFYKSMLNVYLKKKGFTLTDFFGDIDDFNYSNNKKRLKNSIIEVMVHPRPTENGVIVDLDNKNLGDKIEPILKKLRLIGYADW